MSLYTGLYGMSPQRNFVALSKEANHTYRGRLQGESHKLFDICCAEFAQVDAVLNFDEIPCSLRGTMGKMKTLTTAQDTLVQVRCDTNDAKRIASVVPVGLARKVVDAQGNIEWKGVPLVTFILIIGEPTQDRILNDEAYHKGTEVLWTRCGVMTSGNGNENHSQHSPQIGCNKIQNLSLAF